MSAVLEQYFQTVVVDKLEQMINSRFQEMRDDLQVLKKLQSDYTNLRIELETLKKRVSDSGNEIKEILSTNGEKVVASKPTVKKTVTSIPTTTKAVVKKPAVKKKVATKKTAKK
jgi:regulator of replication initiation timing